MTSPAFTALEIQNTNHDEPIRAPIIEVGHPWRQCICDAFQIAGFTCLGLAFFAFLFLPHYLWYRYISENYFEGGD